MKVTDRLAASYNHAGLKILDPTTGRICTTVAGTALITGRELVKALDNARFQFDQLAEAISNMEELLNHAEPIVSPEPDLESAD